MSKTSADATEWAVPRGLIVLLSAAAAVLVVAGIRAAAGIIGPVFLAVVLTIAVSPVGGYLRRRGWPSWAGTLVAIVTSYVVLVGIVLSLVYALTQFASLLPQYQEDLAALVRSATSSLTRVGVDPAQIEQISGSFDADKLAATVTALLSGLLEALSNLLFLILLLLFLGIDAASFPAKLAARRAERGPNVSAVESCVKGTRGNRVVAPELGVIVGGRYTDILF
jgi:predicted PurR-regulated permease PerM